MTTSDAFTGENFRRGGYLDRADRYPAPPSSSAAAASSGTLGRGRDVADHDQARSSARRRRRPSTTGRSSTSRASSRAAQPPGASGHHPGRGLRRGPGLRRRHRRRDLQPARHAGGGRAFYADVKGRLARYGREPDELKIMPAATFALGDTEEEAAENAPRHPPPAGRPADRDRLHRAGVGPGHVGLRPRRAAAGRRPRRRRTGVSQGRVGSIGDRVAVAAQMAGAGRGEEAVASASW